MFVIVIDVEHVVKALPEFVQKFNPQGNGMVVLLKNNEIDLLSKGKERLKYLVSKDFDKNIVSLCHFTMDKKSMVCKLHQMSGNKKFFSKVVKELEKTFPQATIVFSVDQKDKNKMELVLNEGFHSPYFCQENNVCFLKDSSSPAHLSKVKNELKYMFSQKEPVCKLNFFIHPLSAQKLYDLCQNGKKEYSGVFISTEIKDVKNKIIYELSIEENQLQDGKDESVDAIKSVFNFHTHPKKAYQRNHVRYGWPSAQDYLAYLHLALKEKSVFHCVATLEGVYILSLNTKEIPSNIIKIIKTKYKVKNQSIDPKGYVQYIKSISENIFDVQFLYWSEVQKKRPITVSFLKNNRNCFVNDESVRVVEGSQSQK